MDLQKLFSVRNYCVIVTGAASGLGLAFSEALASQGARVTLLDLDKTGLEREVARLRQAGFDVRGEPVDVTDRLALDAAFDEAAAAYGGLDVVFANASIDPGPGFTSFTDRSQRLPEKALENYSDERWHRVIGVSLDAVFYSIRAAVRHMKPRRAGRIIVTTSISAVRPAPGIGMAYAAAKAGAAQLVRASALELAKYNVLINAIAPGPFVTNIGDGRLNDPALQAALAKSIPLGRMASTEEIKGLALFLASPASSFVTGEQIVIDGGTSLGAVD